MSNELRDKLAYEWQNTKCFEGQLIIENARTRWAKIDYGAGWDAAIAHLSENVEFDKQAAIEQAKHEDSDGYFGFLTGSEWMFDKMSAHLGKLKDENEILKAQLEKCKEQRDGWLTSHESSAVGDYEKAIADENEELEQIENDFRKINGGE